MGWYRIDPQTGAAAEGGQSRLSRPPDFVLLNAVPGVDDAADACYLGDGPSDMGAGMVGDLRSILPADERVSADELRELLFHLVVPERLNARAAELRRATEAFWSDVDSCYEDDWERPARKEERRWIGEDVVRRMCATPDH